MRRKPVWLHLVEVRSEAKNTHLSYLQLRSEFLFRCTMIDIRTRAWFPFRTTEKEEMESKHLRVQCSSLMGLRQLLLALPASQIDDGLKGHLRGLLNDGKFWNLSKSSLVLVRGSYSRLWKGAILADLDQAKVFLLVCSGFVQKISFEPFVTRLVFLYARFTVGCTGSYTGITVCLSVFSGFVWKISSEPLTVL